MYSNIVKAVAAWWALARPTGADHVPTQYQQPSYSDGGGPGGQNTYTPTQFGHADAPYHASPEDDEMSAVLDLSLVVIPVLVVVGMALLFPTTTKVSVRKRREVQGKI